MNKLKKFAIIGAAVLVIGATSVTALAASGPGVRGMMSGFSNRATTASSTAPVDQDKLEALQAQCLERMKTVLDAKVAAGTMTQAQEDAFLAAMKERQETCTGTGYGSGMMNGAACGKGMMGSQKGQGCGMMSGR